MAVSAPPLPRRKRKINWTSLSFFNRPLTTIFALDYRPHDLHVLFGYNRLGRDFSRSQVHWSKEF